MGYLTHSQIRKLSDDTKIVNVDQGGTYATVGEMLTGNLTNEGGEYETGYFFTRNEDINQGPRKALAVTGSGSDRWRLVKKVSKKTAKSPRSPRKSKVKKKQPASPRSPRKSKVKKQPASPRSPRKSKVRPYNEEQIVRAFVRIMRADMRGKSAHKTTIARTQAYIESNRETMVKRAMNKALKKLR